MKYIDEFRDKRLIDKIVRALDAGVDRSREYRIMEVCGTHTMNIFRFGLRSLLPENIKLISGPGCPVCVTPNDFIDKAIWLANRENTIITTFGDMLRVPGSCSSLEHERAKGRTIKMVYSTLDAISIAKRSPGKEVIFMGVGFETTAPTVAKSILIAKDENIKNYSVLCGHKTMPEALRVLAKDKEVRVDGFLLPGHVSAITGTVPYEFLAKKYGKRCVVSGFEVLDILEAILMLVKQTKPRVEVEYSRVIERSGNVQARRAMNEVFKKTDSIWRGIGTISNSGLAIRNSFSSFDAQVKFNPKPRPPKTIKGCICGEILRGKKTPPNVNYLVKYVIRIILSAHAWFPAKALVPLIINMGQNIG